ncbi:MULTISPECIES: FkbM family methyltransferase [unclassified Plantactinospora]|uniref:FkbM family methyltransferase n=1 Tax=unclassified Plantactinospora TaxID=2631981 RepID=UPI00131F0A26|nr:MULTISPECIES: FkbM family methyltransferase [unclassified Plantactinospora]
MSLRSRLGGIVRTGLDPRLTALIGSGYLSVRARGRCVLRHDDGDWIHRYRDGVLVNTRVGGPTPAMQDRMTTDVFLHDYRPQPGDTVLDIGAGVGGEVRLFSRLVGPEGRVVSIEAHPRTFRCLTRTVAENGLTNVTTLQCAVVGRPGPVLIEDDPELHIRNGLTSDPAAGVLVPGRTLEEILTTLDVRRVDLLKMNIEGAEAAVLAGSTGALDRVRHLVVSCHDFLADLPGRGWQRTFDEVTALLNAAGYSIRTRPRDPRPWIPYYVYASRPAPSALVPPSRGRAAEPEPSGGPS